MKKFGWLILGIIAFTSGMIVTFQWQGSKYGMDLHDFFKKPDIVEKIVEVEVVKVIVISDDYKIQMINQEFRDALLKISAIEYDGYDNDEKFEAIHNYATKALAVPEVVYSTDTK
jgi:hypothetical protein